MSGLREQRAEISPLIPNDLLALYDKIGTSHGGSARLSCGPAAARAASSRSTRPSCGHSPRRPMTRCCAARSAAGS